MQIKALAHHVSCGKGEAKTNRKKYEKNQLDKERKGRITLNWIET
jgi:hypothetical protein